MLCISWKTWTKGNKRLWWLLYLFGLLAWILTKCTGDLYDNLLTYVYTWELFLSQVILTGVYCLLWKIQTIRRRFRSCHSERVFENKLCEPARLQTEGGTKRLEEYPYTCGLNEPCLSVIMTVLHLPFCWHPWFFAAKQRKPHASVGQALELGVTAQLALCCV